MTRFDPNQWDDSIIDIFNNKFFYIPVNDAMGYICLNYDLTLNSGKEEPRS